MHVKQGAARASGRLLLVMLFALGIGISAAEPTPPATQLPFENCQAATLPVGAPTSLWERALQEVSRCEHNTAYLAAAAQWLNEQRRYEEGQLYAERALLLDPAYLPAWIEFALSQTALGSPEAGINALLQARDESHAQLATASAIQATRLTQWVAEIDELLRRYSQPASNTPARTLHAFVGYDSNFYGGPSSGQFELTLPTGPVVLAIPAGLEPRRGPFTGLSFAQSGAIQGNPRWHYTVQAQAKALVNQSSERILSLQGNAERFDRAARGPFLNVGLAASFMGAKLVTAQVQSAVGHELVGTENCQLRLGAEMQLRHYPQSMGLDGNYVGLLQEGICANGWAWQTRLGQDRPKTPAERAGGVQHQIGLQVGKSFQLDNQKALQAQLNLWRQTDQEGYSALLLNNAPRRINRGALRLEYQWDLKSKRAPYVAFEQTVQHSNLTLFKSQSTVIQFGLRGGW
jgi:hypothetical protein